MSDSAKDPSESSPETKIPLRPVLELDLDFLEDPQSRRRSSDSTPLKEFSPDSVDLVKILLLGAPCVGKTSIIQQFVWNEFDDRYVSTDRKHTYYPSVILNDRLYELKISDIPVIPYFPVDSYYEWTGCRFHGPRSATVYVLVFDLSNMDTFQYVRTLREQMIESRDASRIPLVVVGNKQDLMEDRHLGRVRDESSTSVFSGHRWSKTWQETSGRKREEIASLVTDHWKCTYLECSAKCNRKVMGLFKEIMKLIDSSSTINPSQTDDYYSASDNITEENDKNKCKIL